MKPTLKQLKRRPALWVFSIPYTNYVEPRITMPDGSMWAYHYYCDKKGWELREPTDWHQYALKIYEFGGWL